jgi:solute:Na+ symporter, SSS family
MSGFVSIILLPIRYSMIIGLTILALLYYSNISGSLQTANGTDFEKILPATINNFLPVGLMGLVLTGLLGAFMGTFSGTLNAAQAYLVNDIYLKYVNPTASNRKVISMNYIAGLVVVITGIVLGLFVKDVNTILQWIVSGLYGGYVAANMLKWHWWRFNANGFFWGMLAGILPAIALAVLKSTDVLHGLDLYYWPALFGLSMAGSVIGSYATPPTDMETLKSFYKTVRPWGFWKPVHERVVAQDPSFVGNKNFRRNWLNIVLGIIGQLCLTLLPMYIILWLKVPLLITVVLLLIILGVMKRTWWDRLNEY